MISFKVVINPRVAILSGKANAGETTVQLTDSFVSALSLEEREELASCVNKGTETPLYAPWGMRLEDPPIRDTSPEDLVTFLRDRIRTRKEAVEAREKQELATKQEREQQAFKANHAALLSAMEAPLETWLESHDQWQSSRKYSVRQHSFKDSFLERVSPALRNAYRGKAEEALMLAKAKTSDAAREFAEKQRVEAELQETRKTAILEFLSEHENDGPASAYQRHLEGVLPEKELRNLVRERLFKPLETFPRYVRLTPQDARHSRFVRDYEMDEDEGDHKIQFSVEEATELSAAEYKILLAVRQAVQSLAQNRNDIEAFSVEKRSHNVWCMNEKCPGIAERRAVLVKLSWMGKELSREYALTTPGEDVLH